MPGRSSPVEVEGIRGPRYVLGTEVAALEEAVRAVEAGEPAGDRRRLPGAP